MQPRTAPLAARDEAAAHFADDAGLDAEPAAVLAGARRRAVRDGDRQIDTAHLLHSLLEHDPQVRAAVGGSPRLVRLFGYLVQRSIGYGLRWQGTVEDSGAPAAVPAPAAPAESRTSARPTGPPASAAGADPPALAVPAARAAHGGLRDGAGWSPAAAAALARARERATRRGEDRVTGTDLFVALLADPRSRAVEVLGRAGIPAGELTARIESAAEQPPGGDTATC
ncbi:Clp amino terminal domain-containing protein, pathogenicity island component [Streptomyces sp. 2231.1]|uniref:Clp protease N-terminal domain-containing protein n=1 Tax=Streptomyces sp. 2231.1 TaxID=1855347 RepID=UPI000898835D|nr:Clp protease N-terminal domain-containing protein [Streptomyces sp. 2231.1]SEC52581.1 Clp amino terminal domain-containing protein, pathogenicity island component [Streptomyces sp. 2231.1]